MLDGVPSVNSFEEYLEFEVRPFDRVGARFIAPFGASFGSLAAVAVPVAVNRPLVISTLALTTAWTSIW